MKQILWLQHTGLALPYTTAIQFSCCTIAWHFIQNRLKVWKTLGIVPPLFFVQAKSSNDGKQEHVPPFLFHPLYKQLRGGFIYIFFVNFLPETWRDDLIWLAHIFSRWVAQPPPRWVHLRMVDVAPIVANFFITPQWFLPMKAWSCGGLWVSVCFGAFKGSAPTSGIF